MTYSRSLTLALLTLTSIAYADSGMLRITTDPGDAQIFVNGQRKGNSPSQEGQTFAVKLPQGEYTVEARKSDGTDYYYGMKSVFVANDSLQTVNLSLETGKYGQVANGSTVVNRLEWLRCSVGQSWTGSTCAGSAKEFTFKEALAIPKTFNATGYGGKRDWRVPSIRELNSLRVCSTGFSSDTIELDDGGNSVINRCNEDAKNPTIDSRRFPQTPSDAFWSSSEDGDSLAWYVHFLGGSVNSYGRDNDHAVRLVRSSQ